MGLRPAWMAGSVETQFVTEEEMHRESKWAHWLESLCRAERTKYKDRT